MNENEVIYRARPGHRIRGDVQVVGAHLEVLRTSAHGELPAEAVLEDARRPTSPLHLEFSWDDAVCAEKYRLARARNLLNGVFRVVIYAEGPPTEALQSVRVERKVQVLDGGMVRQSVWVKPESAFSREDWREQVYRDARNQIAALENRLRLLGQSEGILAALARAREKLEAPARPARKAGKPRAKVQRQPAQV